jgi:hypothetical protein
MAKAPRGVCADIFLMGDMRRIYGIRVLGRL